MPTDEIREVRYRTVNGSTIEILCAPHLDVLKERGWTITRLRLLDRPRPCQVCENERVLAPVWRRMKSHGD